ncbi:hypothetical protein GF360_01255 [candidate division WWE3 bacterium]|nr:hypothetical protein [candidate division WWE3 bacterium]
MKFLFVIYTVFLFFLGGVFDFKAQAVFAEDSSTDVKEEALNPDYYFDFSPSSYEINEDFEILLTITHQVKNTTSEDWRIKPESQGATISLYNKASQRWVFAENPWEDMPPLTKKLRLKMVSHKEKIPLKLLFKHLPTGEIYETPEKILWTKHAYGNYVAQINESAKSWRQGFQKDQLINGEKEANPVEKLQNQTGHFQGLKNKTNLVFLNIGGFFTAAFVGFAQKDDEKDDKIAW